MAFPLHKKTADLLTSAEEILDENLIFDAV